MDDPAGIFARELSALDGHVQVGVAGGRLLSVAFPDRPQDDAGADHELLDQLEAYLGGAAEDFADVTVGFTLPTDRRRVLEALREVPYGETVTVAQLARMTAGLDDDEEDDLGTVREALRANPVPVVVADHRVTDAAGATPASIAELCRAVEGT